MPEESSKQDAGLLYTLAERTTHLAAKLEYLQSLHEKGTEKITQALMMVQDANRTDTKEVITIIEKHMADDTIRFEKHNERLTSLEKWRAWVFGVAAAAAVVGAAIGKFF